MLNIAGDFRYVTSGAFEARTLTLGEIPTQRAERS